VKKRTVEAVAEEVMTRPSMEGLRVRRTVNRKEVGSTKVVLDLVEFPPGSSHVLHRHPNCEQITYALQGSSLHLSESGKTRVNEGEAVFVEQGEWHGIENDTDEPSIVLIVYGGVGSLEEAGYEELDEGVENVRARQAPLSKVRRRLPGHAENSSKNTVTTLQTVQFAAEGKESLVDMKTAVTLDELTLDELNVNPYPALERIRGTEGIAWVEAIERYLVTRWEDVIYVANRPEVFSSAGPSSILLNKTHGRAVVSHDPPEHDRIRRALEGALRPKIVRDQWADMLRRLANRLIDGFADWGEVELMSEFAAPFAALTLKNVLGLESASAEDVQRWDRTIIAGQANYTDDPAVWAAVERINRELDEAIDVAIARATEGPGESPNVTVISSAAGLLHEPDGLTLEELRASVKLIIGGGLNEPKDGIGYAVLGLLTHPEQLAMVKENPSLFGNVAEEAIRWMSPLAGYPRDVAQDTSLAGTKLAKGDRLIVHVGSANRDESQWKDPDRFDITRGKVKHLAFGMGPHYCLGAWLARQQLGGTALPILFERLPGMRLDLDQPPSLSGWAFRAMDHLHLKWDA
jgi:cytochrome P450/quercetin dioxygenase-like cupin family protein